MSYPGAHGNGSLWNGYDFPRPPSNGIPNAQYRPHQPAHPTQEQYHPANNGAMHHNAQVLYDQQGRLSISHQNPSRTLYSVQVPPQDAPQSLEFINPAHLQRSNYQSTSLHPHSTLNRQSSSSSKVAVRTVAVSPVEKMSSQANLLMSLAEEYFDAAHSLASYTSVSMTVENVEKYQRLVATGLGCLDTAIKNVRMEPRVEARVRLRYAGVLHDETENFMEAEIALGKGITLCEKNHLFDLKYAMQFLNSELMFRNNPRASMKALDGQISDAQTYQHYPWVYALRFLRASQSLRSGISSDSHAAISNYRQIAALSVEQQDQSIHMVASLLEAMTHLRSSGHESLVQAQNALAQVWKYQLDDSKKLPHLIGLAHILDVICSIRHGTYQIMVAKLKAMQEMMDKHLSDTSWSPYSDVLAIPMNQRQNSSSLVSNDTRKILAIGDDGHDNLMLAFLNKRDMYCISYLLSGMVMLRVSEHQSFKFLEAGLTSLEGDLKKSKLSIDILPDCVSRRQWRGELLCYISGYMAICAAGTADWPAVKRFNDKLQTSANALQVPLDGPLGSLTTYLAGMYYQGVGEFDAALRRYQDPRLELISDIESHAGSRLGKQVERDLALLASLNSLWILQVNQYKRVAENARLIDRLKPLCDRHPNRDIQMAFHLIMATVESDPPTNMIDIKGHLKNALQAAQTSSNTQFLCITLTVMCGKFFANVVGEQAEKSALAATTQAKKSGNTLWKSVAEGLLARSYEMNGKFGEGHFAMEQARVLAQKALPDF